MEAKQLLRHPFWAASDPARMRLVRVSAEFPPCLNPFIRDGVSIRAAGIPGEAPHSKYVMARQGILEGLQRGLVDETTTIVEATSGNTGHGMATVCNALGLPFVAVMSTDVPNDKIDAIRVIGRRTQLHLLSNPKETTVQYARRLGAEKGMFNPDQYSGEWNAFAHYFYLAPQLWEQAGEISILAVPAGTMGTSLGLRAYADEHGHNTRVIPVLCAQSPDRDHEVPGARTLTSVEKDIRNGWQKVFKTEDLEYGNRHASFLLSFLTWAHVPQHLGPSFGLGFAGALRFLAKHEQAGTLDQFRKSDGSIQVVLFGPDDCRPYRSLYFGELKKKEFAAHFPPKDLLSMLDM